MSEGEKACITPQVAVFDTSAARYCGESGDLDNADWIWGYEVVNLSTGATEDRDFGPLEVVLFTGMRRPGHLDKMYGVLTQLKEFDVASQSVTRTIVRLQPY